MIIRRLQLHPFAGSADREVTFAPGLNVVLGPNEAGKTTLRKALRQVLFVPTKLTKRQGEEEVLPYLPLSGGDTIRVSVELEAEGRVWKLSKRWASGNSTSELKLPDGGILSETSAVEEALATLRGLTQGTWEHVLFATQGEVGSSLDRLGEEGNTRDLNEVMRRAVFETDGVSLERLGESLNERRGRIYGHWDKDLNRPEGNRGIERPWLKEVGSILAAWYARERSRVALEEAEAYYRRLDELNGRISAAVAESDALKMWVDSHEAVAIDTTRRAGLEGRLAQVQAKGNGLRQVSQEWPVAESRRGEQEALAIQFREKTAALAVELAGAKAWEDAGKMRGLLEGAEKLRARVELASRAKDEAPRIDAAQIDSLEKLDKERDRLRTRLEAASLKVAFRASKAIDLETRAGVGEKLHHSLGAGKTLEFDGGGRVFVRHEDGDWEIEVTSGDIDVAAEEKRYQEIATESASLLERIGAVDLADARVKYSASLEKSRDLAAAEKQLFDLLGPSRTLEDLRREVNGVGGSKPPEAPARSIGDIAADHARSETGAAAAEKDAKLQRSRIEAWVNEHQSTDTLLDRLVELRGEHQELKSRIDALLPLPEGYPDAQAFLDEFRTKKEDLDRKKTAMNQLLVERAELKSAEPAMEPAEAADSLSQNTIAFERAVREGEAITRIQDEFEKLRVEMDEGTLDPWLAHLSEVIAPLTRDRYNEIRLDTGSATRDDQLKVPLSVLSAGTRACLGLAVRLSMARWFLEGRDGFLLLDDPLVDLDPERQAAAAVILQHFAKDKQVILMTCHPHHAGILGGNLVAL